MNWPETPSILVRARAEEPFEFAARDGILSGIFTPPAPESRDEGICIVFPGHPRFGVQRFPVLAARQLAAEGFSALRFDLHGHGESSGATAIATREEPYGDDVRSAVDAMWARGHRQFLLVGYCFDALSAFSAFGDHPESIRGLLIAAPPVLERSAVAKGVTQSGNNGGLIRRVRTALGRRPEVDALAGYASFASEQVSTHSPKIAERFAAGFDELVRSSAEALFVYGKNDPLYREFQVVERQLIDPLAPKDKARISVEVSPELTHAWEGQRLLERTIAWAREFCSSKQPR